MQPEDYFDFLAPNNIRLKGTRIGIETVLYDLIHRGRTPDEIVASYPSLTLEQVYATMTYILFLNPKTEIGETVEDRWLIWAVAGEGELADRIVFLPLP